MASFAPKNSAFNAISINFNVSKHTSDRQHLENRFTVKKGRWNIFNDLHKIGFYFRFRPSSMKAGTQQEGSEGSSHLL